MYSNTSCSRWNEQHLWKPSERHSNQPIKDLLNKDVALCGTSKGACALYALLLTHSQFVHLVLEFGFQVTWNTVTIFALIFFSSLPQMKNGLLNLSVHSWRSVRYKSSSLLTHIQTIMSVCVQVCVCVYFVPWLHFRNTIAGDSY